MFLLEVILLSSYRSGKLYLEVLGHLKNFQTLTLSKVQLVECLLSLQHAGWLFLLKLQDVLTTQTKPGHMSWEETTLPQLKLCLEFLSKRDPAIYSKEEHQSQWISSFIGLCSPLTTSGSRIRVSSFGSTTTSHTTCASWFSWACHTRLPLRSPIPPTLFVKWWTSGPKKEVASALGTTTIANA